MSTLYTLGYACWTPGEIDEVLRDREAVLVDVRRYASSKKPGFAKGELRKRFGKCYHHLPGFGNANYRGGPVRLQGRRKLSPHRRGRLHPPSLATPAGGAPGPASTGHRRGRIRKSAST